MNKKALIFIGIGLVVLAGAYFAFSHYLVSRLDGTGGVTAKPDNGLEIYRAEKLGVSFGYPSSRYDIDTPADGSIVLKSKDAVTPVNGEGAPTITLESYDDAEGLPLDEFLKNEPKTNFKLSKDQKLDPLTLNNSLSGYSYHYSGLYENDAVAVLKDKKVYVFTVAWAHENDWIRTDFIAIINSLTFL